MEWLSGAYLWIKALHVISVIAWMAGLLYLPRLFVYHCEVAPGSAESERFKVMERRLLRAIMNPAMVAVYVFGGLLAASPGAVAWSAGWIYAKFALVAFLTVLHHMLAVWRKTFAADSNIRPARFYRIVNELPTLAMAGVVILVVVKPF